MKRVYTEQLIANTTQPEKLFRVVRGEVTKKMEPLKRYGMIYANFAAIDFKRSYQMINKLYILYDRLRSISKGKLHKS